MEVWTYLGKSKHLYNSERLWENSITLIQATNQFDPKVYKLPWKKEIKKALAQVLSCQFCGIFNNTFFTGHLWETASELTFINPFILLTTYLPILNTLK